MPTRARYQLFCETGTKPLFVLLLLSCCCLSLSSAFKSVSITGGNSRLSSQFDSTRDRWRAKRASDEKNPLDDIPFKWIRVKIEESASLEKELSEKTRAALREAADKTARKWERTLEVRRSRDADGNELDYDLTLTLNATDCNALATALNSGWSRLDGRPTGGTVNVCINQEYWKGDLGADENSRRDLYHVMIHESLHILIGGMRPVNVTRRWWTANGFISRNVSMITSPRVRKEVRQHFDCPTLEGAEVEAQGGLGTKNSHWEMRLFYGDDLTGHFTGHYLSRINLAVLEDTHWYLPDFEEADILPHGYHKGCAFAKQSCGQWIHEHKTKNHLEMVPYCDVIGHQANRTELQCSVRNDARAYCSLSRRADPVPRQYQYFDDPHLAGNPDWADYCPMLWSRTPPCSNALHKWPWRDDGDQVSTSECGKCIRTPSLREGICADVECQPSVAIVHLDGETYGCEEADTEIVTDFLVDGRYFRFFCPDPDMVCKKFHHLDECPMEQFYYGRYSMFLYGVAMLPAVLALLLARVACLSVDGRVLKRLADDALTRLRNVPPPLPPRDGANGNGQPMLARS